MPLLGTRGSASVRALALDGFQRARVSFVYVSNALQAFTVPVGVSEVRFEVAGGAGGGGSNTVNTGGGTPGGLVSGRLAVTPGNTLYLAAAQAGYGTAVFWDYTQFIGNFAGGWPGGGNAGTAQNASFPVAFDAGGSGGGYSGIFTANALTQGNALVIASGGGAGPGAFYDAATDSVFTGQNATVSAGGARGGEGYPNNTASSGSALQGGNGDANSYLGLNQQTYPASGGGGGYFGGGGGYSEDSAPFGAFGGGGRGSSYVHSSITSYTLTEAASPGPGYIILSW